MTAQARPMFRRIDHVGIVVSDLQEGQRWLAEVFGLPFKGSIDLPDGQIRGALYGCDNVDIEVIVIGDPEVRARRLGDGRHARIEHIAVEVDDLDASVARLAALGVHTTPAEPLRDEGSRTVWTVEATTGGISYQFIERTPTIR